MKLNQLHHVVQAAMGWLDRHLWMLTAGDRSYGVFIPGEDDWNERIDDAETTTLATILSGGLKEFGYLYDFGDSWQHEFRGLPLLMECATWVRGFLHYLAVPQAPFSVSRQAFPC